MTALRPRLSSLISTLLLLPALVCSRAQTFPVTTFDTNLQGSTFVSGDFGTGPGAIVYFANGNIQFLSALGAPPRPSTPPGTGCAVVRTLVSADFNNDGNLDIAFSCSQQNTGSASIVVMKGDGTGNFLPLAVADSTNDVLMLVQPVALDGSHAPPDLVGLSGVNVGTGTTSIVVMKNNGAGAFASTSYPLPQTLNSPVKAFSGDFNGDGKPDLAIVSTIANPGVSVVLGNGDGTFQTAPDPTPFPTSIYPSNFDIAAGDFDGDGKTDLAYISSSNVQAFGTVSNLQVLLGSALGPYLTTGASVPLPYLTIAPYPQNLYAFPTAAGIDLALSGYSTTILENKNDGSGSFTVGPSYMLTGQLIPLPGGPFGTLGLAALTELGGSELTATGNGAFTGIPATPTAGAQLVPVDLDGDGITDLVSTANLAQSVPQILVQIGRGNGTFTTIPQSGPLYAQAVAVSDLNNDGHPDIIGLLQEPNTGQLLGCIYVGDGAGHFSTPSSCLAFPFGGHPSSAVIADFNKDGIPDLVVSTWTIANGSNFTFTISYFAGMADGSFAAPVTLDQQTYGSPVASPLITIDLNNDGNPDLFWNGTSYLNNGSGVFTAKPSGLAAGAVLTLGDINSDNIPDAVTGSAVYLGNGDGTFAAPQTLTLPTGATAQSAAIGPFSGAHTADIALQYTTASNQSQAVALFDNTGGTFTADAHVYYTGTITGPAGASGNAIWGLFPACLNNSVCSASASAHPLDLLTFLGTNYLSAQTPGIATSLLNTQNPAPDNNTPLPSSLTLTASTTTPQVNQQVTFSGVLSLASNATPTGSIALTATGPNGAISLGSAPLDANGNFTAPYTFTAAGIYVVKAAFAGDPTDGPSTAIITIRVGLPSTTMVVTASTTSTIVGTAVTFTATVTPSAGRSLDGGVITFVGFGTAQGCTVPSTQFQPGSARFTCTFTSIGVYQLAAHYGDDPENGASDASVRVDVGTTTTAITLTPLQSIISTNGSVNFTATVTGNSPSGGTVNFVATTASGSQTTLGSVVLNAAANGVATLNATFSSSGTYTVTAAYTGDSNNLAVSSNAVTVTVQAPTFDLGLQPPAVTVTDGQSAYTTLTITPVEGYSGTVRFSCGGLAEGMTCSFTPASVTSTGGSSPTSTLTVTTLAPPQQAASRRANPIGPLGGVAWAGLILLTLTPRRTRNFGLRLARTGLFALLLLAGLFTLSGCGSDHYKLIYISTPIGQQNITVYANDATANITRTTVFQVNVQ